LDCMGVAHVYSQVELAMTSLASRREEWSSPVASPQSLTSASKPPLLEASDLEAINTGNFHMASKGVQLSLFDDETTHEEIFIDPPPRMSYGNL
jgi:hypothetical protein